MKHVIFALLMLCGTAHAACDWNAPGSARYTGTVAAAIDAYTDISEASRASLKRAVAKHLFDDVATIRRDSITSNSGEYTGLRDMHWARGLCKGEVNRGRWDMAAQENGLVYCAGADCIIVPAVCGNVARLTRVPRTAAAAPPEVAGGPGTGAAPPQAQRPTYLLFEPTPLVPPEQVSFAPPVEVAPVGEDPVWWPPALQRPSPGLGIWISGGPLLVASPVPEVSTWAMCMVGMVFLLFILKGKKIC